MKNDLRQPAFYMMANKKNGTIYSGVSGYFFRRVWQHRNDVLEGFTKKYNCKLLVYYELYETVPEAIAREKQVKAGSRAAKLRLIESLNPDWRDLYEDFINA